MLGKWNGRNALCERVSWGNLKVEWFRFSVMFAILISLSLYTCRKQSIGQKPPPPPQPCPCNPETPLSPDISNISKMSHSFLVFLPLDSKKTLLGSIQGLFLCLVTAAKQSWFHYRFPRFQPLKNLLGFALQQSSSKASPQPFG